MEQVKTVPEASAELARRMALARNLPKLAQMQEHVFYAEVVARLARAEQTATRRRERLARHMGLYGKKHRFQTLRTVSRAARITIRYERRRSCSDGAARDDIGAKPALSRPRF